MYQFAIDMGEENSYTPAAPQGVFVARSSLKTEQIAIGIGRLRILDRSAPGFAARSR
jgi:hypothetical protein